MIAEIIDGLPAEVYHADELGHDRPSLSKSVAHVILTKSAAHAYAIHPRLGGSPDTDDEPAEEKPAHHLDLGTIAHSLLLEGDDSKLEIVDAKDWRTNAAKDARDAARAAGRIPLLAKHDEAVRRMVATLRERLDELDVDPQLFRDGKPERTIVWEEDGVLCRARADWLRDDLLAIDDLKTTGRSANPEKWARAMFETGYDLQAAFYLRGLQAITGSDAGRFRFVAAETTPPYGVCVFELAPDAMALADAKVDYALRVWRAGIDTGRWPGYPRRVCHVEAPPWEEMRFLEMRDREAA